MNKRRICQVSNIFSKMNLLKLLLISVFYFLWTSVCDTTNNISSKNWFETHGLSCTYCRKKIFNEILLKNSFEESPIQPRHVTIAIQSRKKQCRLDDKFLSFTLDSLELMKGLHCFPLSSLKINNLVKRLAPAYFRVGGTPQDFLFFKTHISKKNRRQNNKVSHQRDCAPKFENWQKMKPFFFSLYEFDQLLNFTVRNDLEFIFGLNVKLRDKNGRWDTKNAKMILDRVKNNKNVHWTLGNEPNRFTKYGKKSEITGVQLAEDFKYLRKIIPEYGGGKIIGPDISRPNKRSLGYFKQFLKHNPPIDAVTYHLYDMHRSKGTRESFLNPIFLYKLQEEMEWITNTTQPTTDIWVGETGSASGGGAPNLSDRFISGFLYLGKIGIATELCHKVFIRQSFYGGHYGMLDAITHDPLPDYWTSLLFKELIGTVVLSVHMNNSVANFRTHAYCSKKNRNDIVIMFINMNQKTEKILHIKRFHKKELELYILTNKNDLQSRDAYLNDHILKLNDYKIPDLKPLLGKQPVEIPKLSYGFVVVKSAKMKECL